MQSRRGKANRDEGKNEKEKCLMNRRSALRPGCYTAGSSGEEYSMETAG